MKDLLAGGFMFIGGRVFNQRRGVCQAHPGAGNDLRGIGFGLDCPVFA